MKITIDFIPHNQQRYNTVGDWTYDDEGNIEIRVSQTPNIYSSYLVAIHELVEAVLCMKAGITPKQVDEFDISHPELESPGDDLSAPYYEQHLIASSIEEIVCSALDITLDETFH